MARTMYDNLCRGCQTAPDLTAAIALQEEILNTRIVNGDIGKFIMDWLSGITTLGGYGYDIPWATILSRFLQHFPTSLRYVLAANKCLEILDDPTTIPSRIVFNDFAQQLIGAQNQTNLHNQSKTTSSAQSSQQQSGSTRRGRRNGYGGGNGNGNAAADSTSGD